mgnify:CR=1 FL=1
MTKSDPSRTARGICCQKCGCRHFQTTNTEPLRDGNRIVRARTDEIVDALIGARLGPEQFLAMLTGCIARDRSVTTATSFDRTRRISTPDATLFLEQTNGAWRIVAGELK